MVTGQAERFAAQAWLVVRVYAGYKRLQLARRLGVGGGDPALVRHHRRSADAIYRMATRLEGLPVKVCQFRSRADILPDEYVSVLRSCRTRCRHARWRRCVRCPKPSWPPDGGCSRPRQTPIARRRLRSTRATLGTVATSRSRSNIRDRPPGRDRHPQIPRIPCRRREARAQLISAFVDEATKPRAAELDSS
jgi:hypothetical protein